MKIEKQMTDAAALAELGQRLGALRVARNLTQAQMAAAAGVSKRTVERMEAGESAQLSSFVRLCRALELMERLDTLVPESLPSPLAQLKLRGKRRQRASSRKGSAQSAGPWTWDDKT